MMKDHIRRYVDPILHHIEQPSRADDDNATLCSEHLCHSTSELLARIKATLATYAYGSIL
jgi:hypothetical protein